MDYAEAILLLFAAIMVGNVVGMILLGMRLDDIRDRIEEVLRWI